MPTRRPGPPSRYCYTEFLYRWVSLTPKRNWWPCWYKTAPIACIDTSTVKTLSFSLSKGYKIVNEVTFFFRESKLRWHSFVHNSSLAERALQRGEQSSLNPEIKQPNNLLTPRSWRASFWSLEQVHRISCSSKKDPDYRSDASNAEIEAEKPKRVAFINTLVCIHGDVEFLQSLLQFTESLLYLPAGFCRDHNIILINNGACNIWENLLHTPLKDSSGILHAHL